VISSTSELCIVSDGPSLTCMASNGRHTISIVVIVRCKLNVTVMPTAVRLDS
jgi:hypothetical protein